MCDGVDTRYGDDSHDTLPRLEEGVYVAKQRHLHRRFLGLERKLSGKPSRLNSLSESLIWREIAGLTITRILVFVPIVCTCSCFWTVRIE